MHTLKIAASIIILFAIIIGFSTFTFNTLDKTSKDLDNNIAKIESSIKGQLWNNAEEELREIKGNWMYSEKIWSMLLDHLEIDNISNTLSKLSTYIEARDSTLSLGELAALKQYVKHIPDKEAIKLKNIF
ncbi:MAG: DUF4363 family protein [Clostridia bacterium]|nr:DUF4363 family protein [Clostridia bacterium]